MAYDHGLVARIADALAGLSERSVRQKNVFGGRGFLIGRSTFVIAWNNDLLVKTPRDEYESLLNQRGVTPFQPDGESPMGTWLVVDADEIADDPQLTEWLQRGLRAIR